MVSSLIDKKRKILMLEPIGHKRLREETLCCLINSIDKCVYLYPNIPKNVAMNHNYIIPNTHRKNTVGLNFIPNRTLHRTLNHTLNHTESTSCNISVDRYFFKKIELKSFSIITYICFLYCRQGSGIFRRLALVLNNFFYL